MPKLQLNISQEAHLILKEWAKNDDRSLTNYLTVLLDNITGVATRSLYLPVDISRTTVSTQLSATKYTQISHDAAEQSKYISTTENPAGQKHTPTNSIIG